MMTQRPNIIFYFTDQQRFDTCGCYGQKLDITPNLDRLARDGVQFQYAFSPQPVCGPCRALFQTGRYATELGCFCNNRMLPQGVKTLADYIQEAGYETAYIGKWHLASQGRPGDPDYVNHTVTAIPKEYRGGYNGFWRAADVLEFTSHGYDGYVFDEQNKRIDFKGYRADCITDLALDFFDVRSDKPFFMTISHIEPHHQNDHMHYEGPLGSKEKYRDYELPGDLAALPGDYRQEYPDYLGACASLDANLGKLITRLKEKGLYENTVILYASDHGSHFHTRNRDSHLCGGDDYKRSCHDASLRVPLVISGGPFRGGILVEDLVSTESLPKTILALAGVDVGDAMIGENLLDVARRASMEHSSGDGQTFSPACPSHAKEDFDRPNEVYAQISESRVGRCIRTKDYKYSIYAPGKNGFQAADSDAYADDFLYDLRKDPYELNNLIDCAEYDEVKKMLREKLLNWIERAEGKRPEILT